MSEEGIYIVEIETGQRPSHLDEIMRGRVPTTPIRGGITHREIESVEVPVVASSRNEAIAIFRSASRLRGRIESCRPARGSGEATRLLRAAEEQGLLEESELTKVRTHLAAPLPGER